MIHLTAKRIIVGMIIFLLAVFIYILINTYFITKDYLYGPPMLFLKNRYVSVDIYPRGYDSATVFTNNNIEGTTTPEDIDILRLFLKKREVRGVFFVIPDYKKAYPLEKSPAVLRELEKLNADGHEIAQSGTYHTYGPDLARGVEPGEELLSLSFADQLERIKKGREMLTRIGFPPAGFRAPSYKINRETFRVLESLDFLYSSNLPLPPRTFQTLLRPTLTQGVLYPYHPSGYEILEFTDCADPSKQYAKALRLFERIHSLRGVYVFHTYIGSIAHPERLQLLDKFLAELSDKNTWFCTLSEITQWWQARQKLRVETRREGKTLRVILRNHTPFPLPELEVNFIKYPSGITDYSIVDQRNNSLAEGKVPVKEKMAVTLPGNPES